MDTLANLKTFLAVARAGSFSEASRRTGLAVSVVKKRVDQLEHQLGTRLFERTTRRMTLSEAGARHLARLQQATQDLDEAVAAVGRAPARVDGHLRLKVPTTLNRLLLGDMLVRFQQRHPAVSLEVIAVDRPVNPLVEGFDLAVGVTPSSFGGVSEIAVSPLHRVVVASPAYLAARGEPRTPKDLLAHDILSFQPTGDSWTFDGPDGPVVVNLQPKLSSNDGEHLLAAALAGVGISRLSTYIVRDALARGELVGLLATHPSPVYRIYLQVPDGRAHLGRVQALVGFLREVFETGNPPVPADAAAR